MAAFRNVSKVTTMGRYHMISTVPRVLKALQISSYELLSQLLCNQVTSSGNFMTHTFFYAWNRTHHRSTVGWPYHGEHCYTSSTWSLPVSPFNPLVVMLRIGNDSMVTSAAFFWMVWVTVISIAQIFWLRRRRPPIFSFGCGGGDCQFSHLAAEEATANFLQVNRSVAKEVIVFWCRSFFVSQTASGHTMCNLSSVDLVFFYHELEQREHIPCKAYLQAFQRCVQGSAVDAALQCWREAECLSSH